MSLSYLIYNSGWIKFNFRRKSDGADLKNAETKIVTLSTNKNNDLNKMSKEDKIELSWKFLYDITDKILKYFSRQDQDEILACGNLLVANGAKYNHIVDYGIPRVQETRSTSKEISVEGGRNSQI
jgi:hypothetical protein